MSAYCRIFAEVLKLYLFYQCVLNLILFISIDRKIFDRGKKIFTVFEILSVNKGNFNYLFDGFIFSLVLIFVFYIVLIYILEYNYTILPDLIRPIYWPVKQGNDNVKKASLK